MITPAIRDALTAPETRSATYSIGDPAFADYLGLPRNTAAGVAVNETTALAMTAVYRAVSLIAGTIAALPMKSYRTLDDGSRVPAPPSFIDDPGKPVGLNAFEWRELVMVHLLLHGNAYLLHVYNAATALAGLQPLHPTCVTVKTDNGLYYRVRLPDGNERDYSPTDITHIRALSTDGVCGVSPITAARNAIGTGIAGDDAAARMFQNGMLIGGLVTSGDASLTKDQAEEVVQNIKQRATGTQNAGDILLVNADLKFTPWVMSAEDAQFILSREFQIAEIARLYGVPKEMLSASGATSWGSGISELVRGFQKFTLAPWTSRIEAALSPLLPSPRHVEFIYDGLLQPDPTQTITNLVAQVTAGLLTVNEARALQNRPPITPQEVPLDARPL